jgi:hypothetical protein
VRRLRSGIRIAALAAGAVALTACGGGAASRDVVNAADAAAVDASQPTAEPTAASSDPKMSEALEQWKDFPAEGGKRPLVVLQGIAGGGWRTSQAKSAYMSGGWRIPSHLPETPDRVDGYPVISAREALKVLRAEDADGRRQPPTLQITEVRMSSIPDAVTDRGPRRLPAWRVTFREGTEPLFIPAVAAPVRFADGTAGGWNGDLAVGDTEATTLMLRHLGAQGGAGRCGAHYRVEIEESPAAVAYRVVRDTRPAGAEPNDAATCAGKAMLFAHETPIELAAPLGGRVLVRVGGVVGHAIEDRPGPTPLIDRKDVTHPALG